MEEGFPEMLRRRHLLASLPMLLPLPALAQGTSTPAQGEAWPTRAVRIIVTFPPGGTTDILARLMAERLGRAFGATFVVENRAGAGGNIGTDLVAKAPADGHTLLLTTSGPHGSGPALFPNQPFDPMGDFTHIALLANPPNVLVVRPESPLRSLADLLAAARANAARPLTYGSPGNGTLNHLNGEMLRLAAGIPLVHVPYRGAAPALTALLTGEIDLLFDTISSSAPQVRDGRMRQLAMSSATRIPAFPAVPTYVEQGLPDVVVQSWFGISAPRALPPALVARLHEAVMRIVHEPEMTARLVELGSEPNRLTPAQFTSFVGGEIDRWKRVVTAAGIKMD